MNLLFYTRVTDGAGERLHKMIEALVPENSLEVYRSIESLSRRLRQPVNNVVIAVLLAASKGDLLDFISIRDLLRDVRIILVLPDRDEDTVSKGHYLRPRFVSYTDSDFADVFAVLEKCSERAGLRVRLKERRDRKC